MNQVHGSCSSYFNQNNLGSSREPQPREQNSLIWFKLSDGGKESPPTYARTINRYSFTAERVYSMITTEKGTLKTVGPPRGCSVSPTTCCPPLPGCWLGCLTNNPKTSRAYWCSDDISWSGAAWDSVVKTKWTAQTHRLVEDTRRKDHSLRNNWQDSVTNLSPGYSAGIHKTFWAAQIKITRQDILVQDDSAGWQARFVLKWIQNREHLPRTGPNERKTPRQSPDKLTSPRSGLLGKNISLCYFLQISFQVG